MPKPTDELMINSFRRILDCTYTRDRMEVSHRNPLNSYFPELYDSFENLTILQNAPYEIDRHQTHAGLFLCSHPIILHVNLSKRKNFVINIHISTLHVTSVYTTIYTTLHKILNTQKHELRKKERKRDND